MLLTDQSARTASLLSIFVLSRDLFCSSVVRDRHAVPHSVFFSSLTLVGR